MDKDRVIEIVDDTLKVIKEGYFFNNEGGKVDISELQAFAETNTRHYRPEELDRLLREYKVPQNPSETKYSVVNETTLNTVRALVAEGYENAAYLNFASAKHPGGGFLRGTKDQEESIARASGLYNCLLQAPEYYKVHNEMESHLFTDHMIYSPLVPIIKDEDGEYLERPVTASVITSPAVKAGVVRERNPEEAERIEDVMRVRMEKVLLLAALNGHKTLVLGAWGCGVFKNDPVTIARLFHEALEGRFKGAFEKVVFAVLDRGGEVIPHFEKYFT